MATIMSSISSLLLSLAILASGCVVPREECSQDSDCGQGQCARAGECVPAGALQSARIFWTVDSQPPSDTSCAPVGELAVGFHDRIVDDKVVFRPVPCTLGQIFFDRMAARYTDVELTALDPDGGVITQVSGTLAGPASELTFDLDL